MKFGRLSIKFRRRSRLSSINAFRQSVRRQSFCDREHQAAIDDCLSFDPFSFNQNGLAAAEVDVSRRQVADALVTAPVVVAIAAYSCTNALALPQRAVLTPTGE
jgi:hypothetical protein